MVARGFARFERIRLRGMLGRQAATPRYVCAPAGSGFWRRSLTPLKDPQSWLDVVWSIVGLVTGTLAFAVALVWWVRRAHRPDLLVLAALGPGQRRRGGARVAARPRRRSWTTESLANLAVGALFLLTLPWAVRLVATIHASLASVLLCSRAELQREVARVEGGRDAARVAEAESMRRLERDIHDGPQQRLVRLTMDLGRAKRQVADDPERAAATIDEALAQARETVAELRSLSRGIAPPLLVDRGLAAALEEMLAQSVVPVESRIDVPAQLPPHVETAVYFVVSEALTNVAKHSGAASASVSVVATGPRGRGAGRRTTASAAPTRRRASAWPACGSGSRPSTAPSTSPPRSGGGTDPRCEDPCMRIVIADDSLLLREGLQLLLAEAGHDVVGSVGDGPSFVAQMLEHRPGHRHRRRPDAAEQHRRGPAGRGRRTPVLAGGPADGAVAVRRGLLRRRPARDRRRRGRLPAQGPGQRPRRLPRRARGGGGRRHRARPAGRAPADGPQPRPARRPDRRASARCCR